MLIEEEDRAAVLAPIDGDEAGVGVDGREDEGAAGTLLRDIRGERKTLVKLEQSLSMDDEAAIPEGGWDWETIGERAREYLAQHGKDLEPMAALVEAAAREGPAELAAAMALLADLVEAYWDAGLYPAEDEDGVETRFQPLSGLSGGSNDREGALILPVRRMPLARGGSDVLRHLDKVRADAAIAAAQTASGDAKAERAEEGESGYRQIEATARRAGRAALETARAAIAAALADWRRTIDFIAKRTSPRMPAGSRLTGELEAIATWLKGLVALFPDPAADADAPVDDAGAATVSGEAAPAATGVAGGGFVAGRIARREDALRAVSLAADYFTTHEPLSPIGTTLREVDRRARMSLHELLAELIPDESARNDFYWRSGIKPPEADAQEDSWS